MGTNTAPFMTTVQRFQQNGVHPRLRQVEVLNPNIGPGYYDVEKYDVFSKKEVTRRASAPGWQAAHRAEQNARIPHFLYKSQYEEKQNSLKMLGPGTYEVKDGVGSKTMVGKRYIIDTYGERFKDSDNITKVPGPGSYGDAYDKVESLSKRARPTKGVMSSGSNLSRAPPEIGSSLGPGTYELKDGVSELIGKKTGKRGPFECFSVDRSAPIRTGYYAEDKQNTNLGPGYYGFESGTESLTNRHNHKKGQFSKCFTEAKTAELYGADKTGKFYLPEDKPSVVAAAEKKCGKSRAVFGVQSRRDDRAAMRFMLGNFNPVGPGRYEASPAKQAFGAGHRSVFLSNKNPELLLKQDLLLHERVKGHRDAKPVGHNVLGQHLTAVPIPR